MSQMEERRKKAIITKEDIPTLTQVFTPDWIVRYMAENSVGRIWMESYPNSSLKQEMKYYVEDAEQEEEVQKKLDEVKYKNINPEDIEIIEPCCGSGHILVYVFDLLYKMYEEKGYSTREIPSLILKKNLTGMEIDKRAAQLASFSLIMKARSINSRFFNSTYYVVPEVIEIWDSRFLLYCDYLNQIKETKVLSDKQIKNIEWLVETFRYGKTVGSLLVVEKRDFNAIKESINKLENETVVNIFNSNFLTEGIKCLRHLLRQAEVMSTKYDVMITNPPYLGVSTLEKSTKTYLLENYPDSKTDLFSIFMDTAYIKANGFSALVNPDSWMFLSSYNKLRYKLLNNSFFATLMQLGLGAFDATVQTTAFVIRNTKCSSFNSPYYKIIKNDSDINKEDLFLKSKKNNENKYLRTNKQLRNIPESPIVYWLSDNVYSIFKNNSNLENYLNVKNGMSTTDNNKYTRIWSEVDINKIKFDSVDSTDAIKSRKKWFPYNKGGDYRKWYGNEIIVVNWENDGREIKKSAEGASGGRIVSQEFYFLSSLSWSKISTGQFSLRYYDCGSLFDVAGPSIFGDYNKRLYILGALNSCIKKVLLESISPTLNYERGHICKFPVIENSNYFNEVCSIVEENIKIAREEWDSFENSWHFKIHPLIKKNTSISVAFEDWKDERQSKWDSLKHNEERLNEIFIDIYGLQNELSANIDDKDISIRKADRSRDIKSLIHYLVGLEMGRYSLDVEGLAYAGGEWNSMNYVTYQPDNDGIIPIYPQFGMVDGLTGRIIKLIKIIYGEETYKENIDFIADALGKNNNESSEETLNRYFNDSFFSDHLLMYKTKTSGPRPIYWMFSSGKNNAFKCLVYLHRYNEETLARINSKYFLNESARLNAEVKDTAAQLEAADGREKLRLDKVYKVLIAKQKEMLEYGWVLDHMANQYIHLDLDDGVKVNYAKFQGIGIINDNGAKVKKDLLVPIK